MTDHGLQIEIGGFQLREWRNYSVPRVMVDQDLLASGWVPFWFGLCKQPVNQYYRTGHLELFAFLSLMEYYHGRHVNFFQLGAGLGNWCMALEGITRFKRTPGPASYRALAAEAEPTHFWWMQECFTLQNVNAIAVEGAVCDRVGTQQFLAATDPLTHYGQHIATEKDIQIGNGVITVQSWTVDHLRGLFDFDRIHIVQMDVQRAEVEVVRGCKDSIAGGAIDFFLIETHNEKIEMELKGLLSPAYDLAIELPRNGRLELRGFSQPFIGADGGLHLWKSKSA